MKFVKNGVGCTIRYRLDNKLSGGKKLKIYYKGFIEI